MNFDSSVFCVSPFQSISAYSPASPYFSFLDFPSIKDDFVLPESTQAFRIDSVRTERSLTYHRLDITKELMCKITKEHPNL
jgi:hypothetical protein